MSRPTTLERAFELARTGEYGGIDEIRDVLQAEGYTLSQLDGPSLRNQLRKLCVEAKGKN
jgi:hypothetical protein